MPVVAHALARAAQLCCVGGLFLVASGSFAWAQSCSMSVTNLAFGSVDVTAGALVDSTATATVSCTGLPFSTIGVCISLGPGSGGGSDAANRLMANGANTLRYGLFSDPARTAPWGSDFWGGGGAPVAFNITLSAGGTGGATQTLYGRVQSGQQTTIPASYASLFAGADAQIRYGLLSALLGCNLLTIASSATFSVTATVPSTCRISASNLDFGSVGVLTANRDASTTLAPVCTIGTAYAITLDGGLSAASDPTQRRMTKGSEFVLYGLYRDASRSQPFGMIAGVDTLAGVGSGLSQGVTVYGRVAPQPTPSPGSYADTIVATIVY
jgi:spore coat protein U-like protein